MTKKLVVSLVLACVIAVALSSTVLAQEIIRPPVDIYVQSGDAFTVTAGFDIDQPINGAAVYLDFDDGMLTPVTTTMGAVFNALLQNQFALGQVNFAAGILQVGGGRIDQPFDAMTTTFMVSATTCDVTKITYSWAQRRRTDLVWAGYSVLPESPDAVVANVYINRGADINGDGVISIQDFSVMAYAWRTVRDEQGFNLCSDLKPDGVIDDADLMRWVAEYLEGVL